MSRLFAPLFAVLDAGKKWDHEQANLWLLHKAMASETLQFSREQHQEQKRWLKSITNRNNKNNTKNKIFAQYLKNVHDIWMAFTIWWLLNKVVKFWGIFYRHIVQLCESSSLCSDDNILPSTSWSFSNVMIVFCHIQTSYTNRSVWQCVHEQH